jgi:hypothetical protein
MKVKVAVATVQGKAYFYIINELKQRKIPFFSLIPGQPVPVGVKVVITTEKEKPLVNYDKILLYSPAAEEDTEFLGSEVVRILQDKEAYENVVIGIDPGEVFGVAVVADGLIIHTENCFSIKEVQNEIKNVLKVIDIALSVVTVKIGSGVPVYRELLEKLDLALPDTVILEVVGEQGTNRNISSGRRRGLRDIVSAIRIAGRTGNIYPRGRLHEQNA